MIAKSTFVVSLERATELLMARGYEPVLPVESSLPRAAH